MHVARGPRVYLLLLMMVAPPWTAFAAEPRTAKRSIPVIYSTDLLHPHDDPDDHYDLATLLAIPEFDIRAVILDLGERQKERPGTTPLAQILKLTGRKVASAPGLSTKLSSPEDTATSRPADDQRGVQLILSTLERSRDPVTIITAGSLRDVAAAFNRAPELFRSKVGRLYINIGEGAANATTEWNVTLDPKAYVRIMRSGLPVFWCPCLPMKDSSRSTYWKFRQAELFEVMPRPLLNFFIYALLQVPPSELDPLDALTRDLRPFSHTLAPQERNMWCTASFLDAAGYSVMPEGDHFILVSDEAIDQKDPPVQFYRVRVDIDDTGHTRSVEEDPAGSIMAFRTREHTRYAAAMRDSLRWLLQRFPIRTPEEKTAR